jgi:rhamnosyltransferase
VIKDPVIAVVVAYHPRAGELEASIKGLLQNFKETVVVWNGPHPFKTPTFLKDKRIHLLDMKDNVGLARALNAGIDKAFQLGAAWVYLSDQDSMLPRDFKSLAIKYSQHIPKPYKVAAIGPVYFNQVTKEVGRIIRTAFLRRRRDKPNMNESYIETDYLITSGSFISKTAFKDIGPMLDELFIDLIDVEWGLRAKSRGYKSFVLPKAILDHKLGDDNFKIFRVAFPIHSPLRVYYYFRNSICLYGKDYISLNWKLIDLVRNIFRFFFYVILIKPRIQYLKMALLGIFHGLAERMGKLKNS